ncbi:MAG: YggT family protein [Dokdonella sp.]|uniref:YggT family protein n=2 Tax=Dokdonella sp. TaxID=2291710 RepID=UPI0025C48F22|nr:YggT family protein [Dokdonella sp.]MBX3700905.1 YggT family protein [Dokdonella sp.]MCW5579684.1 YggT family protein [Dokdonella sp.]
MGYFAHAAQILIDFAVGVVVFLIVLRVLLQIVRANFYNPVCQFLYKVTNPLLMPLRRLIPSWRNIEFGGLLLAWLFSAIKLALIYTMFGQRLGLVGLAIMALADLADFVLVLYIGIVFVRVLLSFISVERSNPVVPLVYQLSEPLLRPLRTRLPAPGGLDFSPMLVILAILLARALLVAPLIDAGMRLAQAA